MRPGDYPVALVQQGLLNQVFQSLACRVEDEAFQGALVQSSAVDAGAALAGLGFKAFFDVAVVQAHSRWLLMNALHAEKALT